LNFRYRFSKNIYSNTKFHENPSSGSRVVPRVRTGRQKGSHDKVDGRFSQFCERSYKHTCCVRCNSGLVFTVLEIKRSERKSPICYLMLTLPTLFTMLAALCQKIFSVYTIYGGNINHPKTSTHTTYKIQFVRHKKHRSFSLQNPVC
jgi:hypothetical protein